MFNYDALQTRLNVKKARNMCSNDGRETKEKAKCSVECSRMCSSELRRSNRLHKTKANDFKLAIACLESLPASVHYLSEVKSNFAFQAESNLLRQWRATLAILLGFVSLRKWPIVTTWEKEDEKAFYVVDGYASMHQVALRLLAVSLPFRIIELTSRWVTSLRLHFLSWSPSDWPLGDYFHSFRSIHPFLSLSLALARSLFFGYFHSANNIDNPPQSNSERREPFFFFLLYYWWYPFLSSRTTDDNNQARISTIDTREWASIA